MRNTLRVALLGSLAVGAGMTAPAWAQNVQQQNVQTAPGMTTRDNAAQGERREGAERSTIVQPSALEAGANSFTEGQARARLEEAGFTNLQELNKDNQGFWRARATQGGNQTDVAMDFRGRIASGPGLANLGQANRETGATTGGTAAGGEAARNQSATGGNAPDGSPGNPPGTAAGRAIDQVTGRDGSTREPARNPATGTREQSSNAPDGTPGNPASTMTGRAVDRAQGETPRPDGTPGNPPGTAAGRALDRATGTNTTGANPGTPPTTGGGTNR